MIASYSPEARVAAAMRSPSRLVVLYDAACPLCSRCRHWLEAQPAHVDLSFLAAGSLEAEAWLAEEVPWLGKELVVVSDRGEVWIGPAAFLMAMWATVRYREWAYRLSGPGFAPFAERFFHSLSNRRSSIARLLGPPPAECADGRCRHRG